jgi:ADP-heptose:LPS heptosyltransferase
MPLFLRQGDELGKQHQPIGETPRPEADDEQFSILEKRRSRSPAVIRRSRAILISWFHCHRHYYLVKTGPVVELSGLLDTGRSNKRPGEGRKGEFAPAGLENSRAGRICGHNLFLNHMEPPLKILAIQFKSLGDAVLLTPALRAIRRRYPDCVLHVLVAERVAPLLQHLPGLTRVWPMPRTHGRARLKQSWPLVRALRAERFDRSVDFGANDRGAILSLLCGARERSGLDLPGGFPGRRFCYNRRVAPAPPDRHEALRPFALLSAWDITPPDPMTVEIRADPALDHAAAQWLPEKAVICHLGAGMAKKQWPVPHWAALNRMATAAGLRLTFTPGQNAREHALVSELKALAPEVSVLPALDVALFLAVLKRARALITGDTGPMHFAAGLDVPLIALFGPTPVARWGPMGQRQQILTGGPCHCEPNSHVCQAANHCLAAISPEQVLAGLQNLLKPG